MKRALHLIPLSLRCILKTDTTEKCSILILTDENYFWIRGVQCAKYYSTFCLMAALHMSDYYEYAILFLLNRPQETAPFLNENNWAIAYICNNDILPHYSPRPAFIHSFFIPSRVWWHIHLKSWFPVIIHSFGYRFGSRDYGSVHWEKTLFCWDRTQEIWPSKRKRILDLWPHYDMICLSAKSH